MLAPKLVSMCLKELTANRIKNDLYLKVLYKYSTHLTPNPRGPELTISLCLHYE